MTRKLHIADKLLLVLVEHINETLCIDELGLDLPQEDVIAACNLLTLFDLIKNEGVDKHGLIKYRITDAGLGVVDNGGMKIYINKMKP